MKALLKKLDAKLLPEDQEFRHTPYAWLIYLLFFFISYVLGRPSQMDHLVVAAGMVVFLVLYFNTYWQKPPGVLRNIIGILLIGSALSQITPGACVFFIYASAFCCMLGGPRKAVAAIAAIIGWIVLLSWVFAYPFFFYLPAIFFSAFVGGINIYYREMGKKNLMLEMSQREVQQLAQTAERERIARDLHDLIGHTFSVLTLKADLAGKLIDRDPERARSEIKDLENISRDALGKVREVVSGIRATDLKAELASSKYLFKSNEIDFDYQLTDLHISDELNKEMAVIFKELTTNILKHAHASKVTADIEQTGDGLRLKVRDNGKGFARQDGSAVVADGGYGLKGIQERLQKWQGTLAIKGDNGCEVTISIADKQLEKG